MLNRSEAPPERKTPPASTDGAQFVIGNQKTPYPSIAPPPVNAAVKVARLFLMKAQFDLHDAGFSCLLLDDLQDDASALIAEWAGRARVLLDRNIDWQEWRAERAAACHQRVPTTEPAHVPKAAIEWRVERARKSRR